MAIKKHTEALKFSATIKDENLKIVTGTVFASIFHYLKTDDELNILYAARLVHDLFSSTDFVEASLHKNHYKMDWIETSIQMFTTNNWSRDSSETLDNICKAINDLKESRDKIGIEKALDTFQNKILSLNEKESSTRLLNFHTKCDSTIFGNRLGLTVLVLSKKCELFKGNLTNTNQFNIKNGEFKVSFNHLELIC